MGYVINDLGHSIDMGTNFELGMRTPDFVTEVFNRLLEEHQEQVLGNVHSIYVKFNENYGDRNDLIVSYLTSGVCLDVTVDFLNSGNFHLTDVYDYV